MHAVLLTLVIVTGAEQPGATADQQPYVTTAGNSCDTGGCYDGVYADGCAGGSNAGDKHVNVASYFRYYFIGCCLIVDVGVFWVSELVDEGVFCGVCFDECLFLF